MKTLTTTLAGLLLTANAYAQVTIEVPDDIHVLAVNAEKAHLEGGLFSSTKTLVLENGENQVVVRYSPYFTQGSDRIIVDSNPVIAKFNAADETLSFDLPEYRDASRAEKAIGNWQLKLVNPQGKAVTVEQDVLHKDGLQIGRDYVMESQAYNRTAGVAALNSATAAEVQLMTSNANVKVDSSTAEEMLHFWYQKADAKTRAKFKQYINQQ